jgi:hypothetical protein
VIGTDAVLAPAVSVLHGVVEGFAIVGSVKRPSNETRNVLARQPNGVPEGVAAPAELAAVSAAATTIRTAAARRVAQAIKSLLDRVPPTDPAAGTGYYLRPDLYPIGGILKQQVARHVSMHLFSSSANATCGATLDR